MPDFIIKTLLKIYALICCTLFIIGYFYCYAALLYGNFSIRQFFFHILALPTMDFSPTLVFSVLLPLTVACFMILFALKKPLLWLIYYVSETKIQYWTYHKSLLSFITSSVAALLGLILVASSSMYSIPQIFKQIKYVAEIWNGQQQYDTIIDDNFTNPVHLQFKQNQQHNLIVIFAESLEKTFTDSTIFTENLLPHLQAQNGTSFIGSQELSETNWTYASMIATMCGITNKLYLPPREFVDNITCISDVLSQNHYQLYALQGTSLKFANTKKFFEKHHFNTFEGLDEVRQTDNILTHDIKFIGDILDDAELLQIFRRKIEHLAQQPEPFMAITATMNTHPYHGHLSRECPKKYHDMRDAVLCSDSQLSAFVSWFKAQDFAANTTLIIMGDHLMMFNDVQKYLNRAENRETLNLIWGYAAPKADIDKPFNQFDWAPTLLEMAGFEWNERKFGLGTSLLSTQNTLQETYKDTLDERLLNNSKLYETSVFKQPTTE